MCGPTPSSPRSRFPTPTTRIGWMPHRAATRSGSPRASTRPPLASPAPPPSQLSRAIGSHELHKVFPMRGGGRRCNALGKVRCTRFRHARGGGAKGARTAPLQTMFSPHDHTWSSPPGVVSPGITVALSPQTRPSVRVNSNFWSSRNAVLAVDGQSTSCSTSLLLTA